MPGIGPRSWWAAALLAIPIGVSAAQDRLALVIGNANYSNERPLANTLNDARDMAAKLAELGFDVTKVENAGRREIARRANQFLRRVRGSDAVALLYYSGHGMQVGGQNYLIPVDAQITDELDVPSEGLSVNRILAGLGNRGDNAVNLVILDACRNNPFKKDGAKAIGDKGLARVSAPSGTLILYATRPGDTASDNPGGRNGLFTKHLMDVMDESGVPVEESFKKVARNVYAESRKRQSPWQEGVIYGEFYFLAPPGPYAIPVPPPRPVPQDPEILFWQSMDRCGSEGCYRAYLDQYPRGRFAAAARARIGESQPAEPSLIPFTVKTTPEGARVRILNIGPTYRDGMALKPGRYRIEATKPGYEKHLGWHELTADNPVYVAELEATPPPRRDPPAPAPRPAEVGTTPPRRSEPPGGGARAAQERRDPVTGMGFVWVPGDCYRMGSESWEDEEKPVHEVCVDGFWLGKTEVTQRQWEAVMGNNPSRFKNCGRDCPVEQVSWNDVQEYIQRLNGKGAARFRLPTEAEWEHACRSGGKDETYSGSESADRVAWHSDNAGETTHRVGTKAANGLGLHDMSGNVWEWVEDVYDGKAYANHSRNNPANTGGGSNRVFRGGGWIGRARLSRCALRFSYGRDFRDYILGFRLLRK